MKNFATVKSQKTQVGAMETTDFEGIAAMLCTPIVSDSKDGPGWIPGRIEPGPRRAERVTHWDALVIDVEAAAERLPDGTKRLTGAKAPQLSEVAAELDLMGLAGVLHTTHSHEEPTADGGTLGPRYRVVLNPSRPVLPSEIKPLGLAVVAMLGLGDCADTKCLDPARLFYLPRCPAERLHLAQSVVLDGETLDVDAFLSQAKRSATPPPRKPGPAGANVIDAFNDGADIGHLLEGMGYVPKGRNRWMWPGSTSGLPGVVLMDSGRVYSHHPGDPLAGQHSHDAFSVFCTLAHGGNFAAAVKAAARQMGMNQGKAEPVDFSGLVIDHNTGEIIKTEPLLKPVSVGDVLTNPAPPPAFVWDGYLPRGVVALWGAHGGTGKSTAALMLAVAVATGRPLFGVPTSPCPAVFVSLEDGTNIVRHRLAGICRAWAIAPTDLGSLHIVDGTANPELFAADSRSAGDVTPAYAEMLRLVESAGAGLVVVDNASDAFGGDEIQRRQVRAFMRALGQVARRTECAVVLLAHVDKNTSRNKRAEGGEGYSGSTAWHNSARSRLFMSRADDGLLTLEHQKSNLGQRREPITLTWPDGGLPMLASDAPNFDGLNARTQGRADDERAAALLNLIAEFESREQYASPAPQARNNVHALLRVEPAFQRLKLNRDATARIVNQCQRAGWIEAIEYKSAHTRKHCQRWAVTGTGRAFAGLPAPTAPTSPTSDEGAPGEQGADGGAPTAPTYEGGTGGIAHTHESAEHGA